MTDKQKREKMDSAIKSIVIPHFRRIKDGQLNLLSFQFSQYARSFVVEISNCPTSGIKTSFGKDVKPALCRVNYMADRLRIGSIKNDTDYWYDFELQPVFGNIFTKRANEVLENWDEAEHWWKFNPFT